MDCMFFFFFLFFLNEKFFCEGGFAYLKVLEGMREGKSARVRDLGVSVSSPFSSVTSSFSRSVSVEREIR
jgi:hypothetical protein